MRTFNCQNIKCGKRLNKKENKDNKEFYVMWTGNVGTVTAFCDKCAAAAKRARRINISIMVEGRKT